MDAFLATIENSVLIPDDVKDRLIKVLPNLSDSQKEDLRTILESESDFTMAAITDGIEAIVNEGDPQKIQKLVKLLQPLGKESRKATEMLERKKEQSALEDFFTGQ